MIDIDWEAIIARQEFLMRHAPHCPKCDTDQVEIKIKGVPAEWRCRMCKHWFQYEPS